MIYTVGIFLWGVLLVPMYILQVLLFFVPAVKSRRQFEKRNTSEKGAQSFLETNEVADLCFEFSSEGEYQQVASLIEDALLAGKKLELVFFSPSVEKTILELYNRYPSQIRYLRYPILKPVFVAWITARTLILVRYDFFPDFLIWSLKKDHHLKILWMTFKKDRLKGRGISWFKRLFLKSSSLTVFASEPDAEMARAEGFSGMTYDFRMEQIKRRLEKRDSKFAQLFPHYGGLKSLLEKYPREKRLIMGNAWPEDMFLLEHLPQDVLVMIVPHQLKEDIIQTMSQDLKKMGREAQVVSDGDIHSSTIVLNKKGVLCELYADFGKAYVGGGFGVSVHSLLEPLVAGSEHIACGPVHHRSTEFDVAMSFAQMKEVKNSQEFSDWLRLPVSPSADHDKLKAQIEAYHVYQKDVLSC